MRCNTASVLHERGEGGATKAKCLKCIIKPYATHLLININNNTVTMKCRTTIQTLYFTLIYMSNKSSLVSYTARQSSLASYTLGSQVSSPTRLGSQVSPPTRLGSQV